VIDLMALNRDVAAAVDVAEARRALTRAATEITAPSAVSFWTADERTATLRLVAVSDEETFADLPVRTLFYGQGLTGGVAAMRKSISVPDVLEDDTVMFADWLRRHGFRSCEGLPVLFNDVLLGVLTYSRATPLPPGDDARDQLAMVVDQAAIIIRNATRFEALLEVNRQLSSIQSVDALLSSIAEACGRVLGSDSVAFRVVDHDELVLRGTYGDAEGMGLRPRLRLDESLSGAVAISGRPLNIPNAIDDPRHVPAHRQALERFGYHGWFGVPIKAGDRVLGILSIHTRSADGATPSDISIASAFASQAAVLLDNARLAVEHTQLYGRLQDRTQRLEVLHRLALGLTASLGEKEVFTAVARGALELFGDVGCSLWLLDRERGDQMTLVADEGIRFLDGVKTPLKDGAVVSIVPAVAGG
jgi:GAF domain-containing protein